MEASISTSAEIDKSGEDGVEDAGEKMDRIYRVQRHFYDLTRKYYLPVSYTHLRAHET